MLFTTSCSTLSMYVRSIIFSSLKSLKESIRLILLIIYVIRYFLVNCYFRFRNFRKRDLRLNQAHLFTLIPDGLFQHHRLTGNLHQFPSTRSEEHTSELQSLIRIQYAVSCMKKKNN